MRVIRKDGSFFAHIKGFQYPKRGILSEKRIPLYLPVSAKHENSRPRCGLCFYLKWNGSESKPAEAQAARERVHLAVHRVLRLAERFVHGREKLNSFDIFSTLMS